MDHDERTNPNIARPAGVGDGDPVWEAVGQAEPCDWCGRPGVVEQFTMWTGNGTLGCRNPSLCEVCSYWFRMPSDVIDAMYDAGLGRYETVMEPFQQELQRKWREKVGSGTRRPQGLAGESPRLTRGSFRPDLPDGERPTT